eukprot:gene42254-52391_t
MNVAAPVRSPAAQCLRRERSPRPGTEHALPPPNHPPQAGQGFGVRLRGDVTFYGRSVSSRATCPLSGVRGRAGEGGETAGAAEAAKMEAPVALSAPTTSAPRLSPPTG